MTTCADVDTHRARVEGRLRHIPNWYELDWEHVSRSRSSWTPPRAVDLVLEATERMEDNVDRLRGAIVARA